MKKVRHYEGDCFEFHKEVLANKHKGETKTIVTAMERELDSAFSSYTSMFNSDTLQNLSPIETSDSQKTALKDLYDYDYKKFKELRTILTTDENGRQSATCPNCTLDSVSSLDHLVPQTEFPEFSDNPINLIGCCTTCNSKKNKFWRRDGKRIFLNLYLDDIPDVQYLFVNFDLSKDPPYITYEVRNDYNIDAELFSKIYEHYKRLNLCNRFKEHSDGLIDDLNCEISSYKQYLSKENIKDVINAKAKDWQRRYGYNFWKSIFYMECCNNKDVFNYLYSR